MGGALCCEGRLRGGADRRREVAAHILRASTRGNTTPAPFPAPSRALTCHQHTTEEKIGTKVDVRGVGGGASGYLKIARVHHLPSRNHRPDAQKLRYSAHIALWHSTMLH